MEDLSCSSPYCNAQIPNLCSPCPFISVMINLFLPSQFNSTANLFSYPASLFLAHSNSFSCFHSKTHHSWSSTSLNSSPSLTRRHREWYFQPLSERIQTPQYPESIQTLLFFKSHVPAEVYFFPQIFFSWKREWFSLPQQQAERRDLQGPAEGSWYLTSQLWQH